MTEPCTVTGVLRDAAGDLLTSTKLSFQRLALLQAVEGDTVVAPVFGTALAAAETVTTDGTTAAFSIDLMPGVYRLSYQGGSGIESISFAVPVAETQDLAILIGQATTIDSTLIQTVLGYKQDAETAAGQAQAWAGTVGELATVVATAAQIESDRELAEAARDGAVLAAASTGYQPDTATAEGALTDGDVFWTISGDEAVYYEIIAGTATEIAGARVPLASKINDLVNIISSRLGAGVIFAQTDDSDRVTLYQRASDLGLMIPDAVGDFHNLQGLLGTAEQTDGEGALAVFGDADGAAYGWFDTDVGLRLIGRDRSVQADLAAQEAALQAEKAKRQRIEDLSAGRLMLETELHRGTAGTSVYHHLDPAKAQGSDSTETQRIPGIVRLSNTTALVAWQQRLAGYAYIGDAEYQRLVCAPVTYTEGVGLAVGSTVVIDSPGDPQMVSNHPHMFVDSSGDIVCLYNNNDTSGTTGVYEVMRRTSSDGGLTWSARSTALTIPAGYSTLALGSNGSVVQVPVGYPNAGRWLVPIYGALNGSPYSGLIYSDDDGATWSIGPHLQTGAGLQEPSIAMTHEGDVLMAMRRSENPSIGQVHFARISLLDWDAGWVDQGPALNMSTPRCDMSMVQAAPDYGDGVPAIIHVGPSGVARRAQRVRMSYTAGRTWQWSWSRPDVSDSLGAGYTATVMLQPDLVLVAYETAESASTDSDIGIYVVNLVEVLKNGTRI